MNAQATSTPIPLKKITTADIVGKDFLKTLPKGHELLYYVYGAVTGAVTKPSKHKQEQKLLLGRFEAVRISDRQVFTGERLYLPDNDYQEKLAAASGPDKDTGEIREPEFGFMIGWRPQSSSPTGYVFSCEPMTDTKAQDRLSNVRKLVSETDLLKRFNLPALSAPAKDDKKK